MKQTFYTLIFFLPMTLFSQDWRYDEFIPTFKSEILSDSTLEKTKLNRTLRNLSFIGAYQELYEMDMYVDTSLTITFENITNNHEITDAKKYILSKSVDEKILIVNESHHRPEHRHLTKSLLPKLYEQGYRYLAIEAMHSNQYYEITHYPENKHNLADTTIMTRGYPLMKACSGTYVKEPVFGNLIRKAIGLGFTIVGYEQNGKGRELNQAKNIAKIYDEDPNAKILVHCGYGHLIEASRINRAGKRDTFMAGYLKEITGINPITIDQTNYYNLKNVNQAVFAKTNAHTPQVLLKDGQPFKSHEVEKQEYWDMTIFHEPISYIQDRPKWMVKTETNKSFELDLSQILIDYPVRIKLLSLDDRLDAVPIDIMEIDNEQTICIMYGEIEKSKFIIENRNGDRQIIVVP